MSTSSRDRLFTNEADAKTAQAAGKFSKTSNELAPVFVNPAKLREVADRIEKETAKAGKLVPVAWVVAENADWRSNWVAKYILEVTSPKDKAPTVILKEVEKPLSSYSPDELKARLAEIQKQLKAVPATK